MEAASFYLFLVVLGLHCLGSLSLVACTGFSLQWLLLLWGSVVCVGFVAPRHVGSPHIRDETRVPCIGRWILHQGAAGEILHQTRVPALAGGSFTREPPGRSSITLLKASFIYLFLAVLGLCCSEGVS